MTQSSLLNVARQAARAASAAADRAGVTVVAGEEMPDLRRASALLEAVWGRADEGVPLNSDLMRSLVHAGGLVSLALDEYAGLAGVAALTPARPDGTAYGLIAGVAPGTNDRGIGYALKQHQRAWCLERGVTELRWTFDPLVSRNARFNLAKLGAVAREYEESFYGVMTDDLNAGDDSDRLVARWRLDDERAIAASESTLGEPAGPTADAVPAGDGPDGEPALLDDTVGRWVRVPRDVTALRRVDPAAAAAWRLFARGALGSSLASGLHATHMTRTGWYLLTPATSPSTGGTARTTTTEEAS